MLIIRSDRYELHYKPGDAVTFTVAESDDDGADIEGLTTDEPQEVAKIATLVPPLPEGSGLFALQATLLSPYWFVTLILVCQSLARVPLFHTSFYYLFLSPFLRFWMVLLDPP
jgi:hypothetical protein